MFFASKFGFCRCAVCSGPSPARAQSSKPNFSCSVVHQPWESRSSRASRPAAVTVSGTFSAGILLRKTRRQSVCRFAKGEKALSKMSARQQSMLDRLHEHAAALGGECLAIGYKNNNTKVPWQCQHGHTWDARPDNVLNNKHWCPECARNRRRIPLQRLQDHAKARGGRCLSKSKHNRSQAKVLWQCKLGHTWEATPNMVLNHGTWCPKCSRKGRTYKRRSLKDLQEHAASLGGRCRATTYEGMRVPVFWQCYKGHTWRASPNKVLNSKTWCPECAGNALLDLRRLQEHALHRGGECLATEYVNSRSKVTWKCEHGHTWDAAPYSLVNKGSWCPHCRKIGLARLRAHAASLGGKCLAQSYENKQVKLPWQCKEGHKWEATATNVLHGNTCCPQCAASTWRTEAEVRSTLETIFHPASFQACCPSFLGGLQLDGFCPGLSLAFEYQGSNTTIPRTISTSVIMPASTPNGKGMPGRPSFARRLGCGF